MAESTLHAQRDFFNEISNEVQRLKVVIQYIQPFLDQARVRGCRTGDNLLLEILDHLDIFFSEAKESSDRLERFCSRV